MSKKTHVERPKCQLRVRELADYMAASAQAKRSVLRRAKYRKLVRTLQHQEARAVISNWLRDGQGDKTLLAAEAERMRVRFHDDEFREELSEHNADYIEAFLTAYDTMGLPACAMLAPVSKQTINLQGVEIVYNPDLVLRRVNKRNKVKIGGLFLRYAKNKELPAKTGEFQSAFTYGYLKDNPFEPEAEAERPLCLTADANTGVLTPAPSNSVYLFNEMEASCAAVAAQWPTIEPPPNAVL